MARNKLTFSKYLSKFWVYFFLSILFIVNITALLGYIIRWYPIKDIDPYYWTGMISHILVILPLFFGLKFYKIDILGYISKDKRIYQYLSIIITGALLILYFIIQNNIYTDSKWKDML